MTELLDCDMCREDAGGSFFPPKTRMQVHTRSTDVFFHYIFGIALYNTKERLNTSIKEGIKQQLVYDPDKMWS